MTAHVSDHIIDLQELLHILRYEARKLLVLALGHERKRADLQVNRQFHTGDVFHLGVEVHLDDLVFGAAGHQVDAPQLEQLFEVVLRYEFGVLQHAGDAGALLQLRPQPLELFGFERKLWLQIVRLEDLVFGVDVDIGDLLQLLFLRRESGHQHLLLELPSVHPAKRTDVPHELLFGQVVDYFESVELELRKLLGNHIDVRPSLQEQLFE